MAFSDIFIVLIVYVQTNVNYCVLFSEQSFNNNKFYFTFHTYYIRDNNECLSRVFKIQEYRFCTRFQ